MPNSEIASQAAVFSAFLENTPEAVIFLDPLNRVRHWSRTAAQFLQIESELFPDCPSLERLIGRRPIEKPRGQDTSSGPLRSAVEGEFELPDGKKISVIVTQSEMRVGHETWKIITLTHPMSRHSEASDLYRLAHTDELTQLLNRRGFQSRLESSLDRPLALAMIDVDFLKRINDQRGHETGDRALKLITQMIQQQFPQALAVGRLGGDEFGLIIELPSDGEVHGLFQQVCSQIAATDVDWCPDGLTISIGVAVAKQPPSLARNLLTAADGAMYQSKKDGRNRVTVVESG